ncbi:hypothetical protein LDENG_00017690, partial [Lucifuga dentata]
PDPTCQFIVEVDASEIGVGAVLSQRSPVDQKLHPCAFFSRHLTTAESNYDVGNRELLMVKLALEEWRHWLEGAEHPFLVWTDHKNLAPGSKNVKPDALSRQFNTTETPTNPYTILSSSCIVAVLTWDTESKIREA